MSQNKVTQNQLAEHLGVSQTTVWKWRKGAIPDGEITVKLASFFGVSEKSLFADSSQINTTKGVMTDQSNFRACGSLPPIKKLKISSLREEAAGMRAAAEALSKAMARLEKRIGELEGE